MIGIRFFKLHKARQYNYKPVFFDPDKEEREQRRHQTTETNDSDYSNNIRNKYNSLRNQKKQKSPMKSNNFRLLLILIGLVALALYFFLS